MADEDFIPIEDFETIFDIDLSEEYTIEVFPNN